MKFFAPLIAALLLAASPAHGAELPTSLAAVLDEAAERALPVDPLRMKAQEGLAKGVPEARVEAVLRRMVARYGEARALLPHDDEAVVAAAGEAIGAGATPRGLQHLAASAPDPVSRAIQLRSLGDLIQLDVPEVDALRLIERAGKQGVGAVASLASHTSALITHGATPLDAVRALTVADGRAPLASVPLDSRGPKEDKTKYGSALDASGQDKGQGHGVGGKPK